MSLRMNMTESSCGYFEPVKQLGKVALLVLSVAMVPVGSALAQDAPMIHMGSGDAGSQPANRAALRALASQNGEVKIIIGLEIAFEVGGALSEQAVELQRGSIAARQQDIVSALAAPRNVKRFETIPYMALNVSAADLDRLLEMPGVSSIALDIADAPGLSDSVRLVDAPVLWRLDADGADYAIAIMDTGVRPNHAAFNGKIVASACFSTNSASTTSLCPMGRNNRFRAMVPAPGAIVTLCCPVAGMERMWPRLQQVTCGAIPAWRAGPIWCRYRSSAILVIKPDLIIPTRYLGWNGFYNGASGSISWLRI